LSISIKGHELSFKEEWVLSVACGVHNHLALEHWEGHFFTDRLSEEEERLVVDISKSLVCPRYFAYIEIKKQAQCEHHEDSV